MILSEARQLRDHIKQIPKTNAVVPLGHGPDGYYVMARINGVFKTFTDRAAWNAWVRQEQLKIISFAARHGISVKARSPLERMIDEACGVNREHKE